MHVYLFGYSYFDAIINLMFVEGSVLKDNRVYKHLIDYYQVNNPSSLFMIIQDLEPIKQSHVKLILGMLVYSATRTLM